MPNELDQLRQENESLKKLLVDLENTSKMLVRRDIDLRQAYENLKRLDQEKSEFVSIAAHQLRTPLTSLSFAHQMLSDTIAPTLNEAQKIVLNQARLSIDRMFGMIEDLLIVDALDYGSLKFEIVTVNLESLISEVISGFKNVFEQKSLTLTTHFASVAGVITGDERRLKDAFSNVIDNASKYTPDGGEIIVSTAYQNGEAIVTVSDTGIGIEPENESSLFKKFSRFDNAKKVDANGSGLGLYISKKIIEQHGGNIIYKPHLPQGASFEVHLSL